MIPDEVFASTILELFEPVRAYLLDPSVNEVMINGPDCIYIERGGVLERAPCRFRSRAALLAALRNVAQYVGKHADEEHPILEARLPDGSRVAAVLPPAAPDGPHIAIRRFSTNRMTMGHLIEREALTERAARYIATCVAAKLNVIVAGGTASGKTSMLNALSAFIGDGERVVVIEDSKELQLQRDHVVALEARPGDAKGRGRVTIRDLFRTTLRMRPDRIVIGEIRGGEALDLIQAMTSGHGGALTTLHATYPRDVLARLETMALMADVHLPHAALRVQIASAVQLIVQVERLRDGSRRVTQVTEVNGYDLSAGQYLLKDVFVRSFEGLADGGRVRSELTRTREPSSYAAPLRARGYELEHER